jgi:PIN domain nuclease of toxin-antitoxin system
MFYDASALLALVLAEEGANVATRYLSEGHISSVNLAETMGTLAHRGATRSDLEGLLMDLPLDIVTFEGDAIQESALLRPVTQKYGLSLGDRACLASALVAHVPVLTADRAWSKLADEVGVEVIQIRGPDA